MFTNSEFDQGHEVIDSREFDRYGEAFQILMKSQRSSWPNWARSEIPLPRILPSSSMGRTTPPSMSWKAIRFNGKIRASVQNWDPCRVNPKEPSSGGSNFRQASLEIRWNFRSKFSGLLRDLKKVQKPGPGRFSSRLHDRVKIRPRNATSKPPSSLPSAGMPRS